VIDLSRAAAEQLGYGRQGVARVRVRYVGPASKAAFDSRQYPQVTARPPPPPQQDEPAKDAEPAWPAEPPPVRTVLVPARQATFKVQAGAFSSRENAERAVAQLKTAGWASIEPMMRAGGMLYRVIVAAGEDEGAAWTLRQRVVALGYSGATVLRP
jgi:rare lipoprotein A